MLAIHRCELRRGHTALLSWPRPQALQSGLQVTDFTTVARPSQLQGAFPEQFSRHCTSLHRSSWHFAVPMRLALCNYKLQGSSWLFSSSHMSRVPGAWVAVGVCDALTLSEQCQIPGLRAARRRQGNCLDSSLLGAHRFRASVIVSNSSSHQTPPLTLAKPSTSSPVLAPLQRKCLDLDLVEILDPAAGDLVCLASIVSLFSSLGPASSGLLLKRSVTAHTPARARSFQRVAHHQTLVVQDHLRVALT